MLAVGFIPNVVDIHGFFDDVTHREPWIQRGIWILEDHLHALLVRMQVVVLDFEDVFAFEAYTALGRRIKPHNRSSQGALAAARFANKAMRFSGLDHKRDIINGFNDLFAAKKALGNVEILFQVLDL